MEGFQAGQKEFFKSTVRLFGALPNQVGSLQGLSSSMSVHQLALGNQGSVPGASVLSRFADTHSRKLCLSGLGLGTAAHSPERGRQVRVAT